MELITIVIGILAIVMNWKFFASNTDDNYKFFGAISTMLYGAHIYLYADAVVGAIVSLASAILYIIMIVFYENKKSIIPSIIIFAIAGYLWMESDAAIKNTMPLIGSFFVALGYYVSNFHNVVYGRVIYLGSAISWLILGINIGSIPAIVFDIVGIITILMATSSSLKEQEHNLEIQKTYNNEKE